MCISKLIFVTNFPDSFGPRNLWNICQVYGKVVDVFVPNRKSKAGKQYAFVCFIKVDDMDWLIGNLCTLWVGRFHLHANVFRYERPSKPTPLVNNPSSYTQNHNVSYATAVKNTKSSNRSSDLGPPALVLDDTYVNDGDFSQHVMGRVKDLKSIPNLKMILTKEGFGEIKLSYLGGLWVMIELSNEETKIELLQHTGANSWFHELQVATFDFVNEERIVWVDIKGIPLSVWSHATFSKISKKWGDVMNIEESTGSSFSRKWLYIKTSLAENILETFKVIFKGKIYMVRAKELFTWTPCFMVYKDTDYNSDDKDVLEAEQHSEDPFGFYDLLKKPPNITELESDPSLSHPSGFTPEMSQQEKHNDALVHVGEKCHESPTQKENSRAVHSTAKDPIVSEPSSEFSTSFHSRKTLNGGSILDVLDDIIKSIALKRTLWEYISVLINRWNGETLVLGDFNEVCSEEERFGSIFNQSSARAFNQFIAPSGLLEVKMEGYSFTWSHPSAFKMSKLDRFLVSDGIFLAFPAITAVCLDQHLSDHRPIILHEIHTDFGPTLFHFYHSWFKREGFDSMVEQAWHSFPHNDSNRLIRFKNKLQDLKKIIRVWIRDLNNPKVGVKNFIIDNLVAIDKDLDNGIISDDMLLNCLELSQKLYDLKQSDLKDAAQKAKVKWAIEGDENLKFFHGIINKRRAQLAIRGVFVNDVWHTEPSLVKDSFLDHFANRFKQPASTRLKLNMSLPNCLSSDQTDDLDRNITNDEIRAAVWDCGENKSPGPDGYTFEFFRHFWEHIGLDFCIAVNCFFERGSFPRGCNPSFIALIPKQYLDGPFILNEALAWCKRKKKQALIFKVDFAKAYDFVRWDFLLDILHAFGFGSRWCIWIRGIFSDPLAPLLFILVMETLQISVSRAVNDGVFKVTSGLKINVQKSQVLGVGVSSDIVNQGASIIGCSVMHAPFKYLGVTVGDHMSRHSAWLNTIQKVRTRLSKWKVKTLSIGGRLTLLKSVLGTVPLYTMSIYKSPRGFLHEMEVIRNSFFNGADSADRKITWVAWDNVLASKKHKGLGVSSYYALNRALLLKWVWCFLSQDGSLWSRVISAIYGSSIEYHPSNISSCWSSILREVQVLSSKGFDFLSHCKIYVGNGLNTKFWLDTWIMDLPLSIRQVRDGVEGQQWSELLSLLGTFISSPSSDRWICDLNGDGMFRVKDIRSYLDDLFLPSSNEATRWVKYVPIKVNVFAWRARLDRLPTRDNLAKRGVNMVSTLCPVDVSSFVEWNTWFASIQLSGDMLESDILNLGDMLKLDFYNVGDMLTKLDFKCRGYAGMCSSGFRRLFFGTKPFFLLAFADVVSAGIAKGMSEGLKHGVEHGRSQLGLESIEAYDPEAEAKFVAALQSLKDLKFSLLDPLEGLKDAPMDVIMAALYLESDTGGMPHNTYAISDPAPLSYLYPCIRSRAEKKKKCRIVYRTHGIGSAHHARSDGIPVSVPAVVPQGLAVLLVDGATQTDPEECLL
uniref:RNA-directed DNA polymerase, eukaryota n=1 Tax=Tanacetum cinerariifolium TaxID=118510 RepID=A0A6L2KC35_TANCI|nr:RNA-directed DNA polymerase, eukaryota [Tanacetum cinerariifolium]